MKAKKLLALLLAAVMLVSVFAVSVSAAEKKVTQNPTNTSYSVGDKFDPSGLKINDGKRPQTYSNSTASKFSFEPSLDTPLKKTDTVVKVYFNGDYIGYVEITVVDLSSATIKDNPTITEYLPGEKFQPAGLTLTVGSNTVEYVKNVSDFTFMPSLNTALTAADTAIKVNYKGTYVGDVTITFTSNLSIVNQPNKTEYLAGENFDPSGLTIKIGNRDNNISYSSLNSADFSFVPGVANLAADVSSVKVYYVSNYIGEVPVKVYSVLTNPAKTVYNPGESFDPSGLVLRCGTTEIPYTAGDANFSFTPALDTPLKSSDETVAVLYKGMKIADLEISVNGVIDYPSKIDYTVGQEIDGSGLKVRYNGSFVTYPSSRLTLKTNSGKSTIALSDNKISILCDGDLLGEYAITVEGLVDAPDAKTGVEGKKFNPAGLVTKYNGATVAYEDDPVNFKFSPSIDEPVLLQRDKNNKVLKDENGKILPVTYTVYYKGAEVGTFEITVNHDFGKYVQLESGKDHAQICKYCGELGGLDSCENHTHNFKANDDAGLFKLQTETGTCDICGGTVTRTIPDSNKFYNIFDFVHEDGMAQTEMTILEIFKALVVSLVQMIIPV